MRQIIWFLPPKADGMHNAVMPVSQGTLTYLINGIVSTPLILTSLLNGANWDSRPDPDRFTPREMIAHMADWDDIWLERLERTLKEDNPFLPNVDEGKIADERQYGRQDPIDNIKRLEESRLRLVDFLQRLPAEAWDKPAQREFVGDVTMFHLAVIVLGHDAYHIKQAASWKQEG